MPMDDFFQPMCVMDWRSKPDGLGSFIWEWEDGVSFDGGVVLNTSTAMKIAQQEGHKGVYTLTTSVKMPFEKGDIVKRLSDDALFEIISDSADVTTPKISDIDGWQVTMERVTV